jgi:hypothetical protein
VLAALEAAGSERYVTPVAPAIVHLGLGEHSAAITRLEAALGDRNWHAVMLERHFLFAPLRGEERFEALVAAVGCGGG